MNVVLHDFPGDGNKKRMHEIAGFQWKVVVPVVIQTKEIYTYQDLVFLFGWHDGTYYHYKLFKPEKAHAKVGS